MRHPEREMCCASSLLNNNARLLYVISRSPFFAPNLGDSFNQSYAEGDGAEKAVQVGAIWGL